MFGDEALNEISKIPLSDTICRRINNITMNKEENVNKHLINNRFALQIDKSTGYSEEAQLIEFKRFIHKNEIANQFLFYKELLEFIRGQNVFETVNSTSPDQIYSKKCA